MKLINLPVELLECIFDDLPLYQRVILLQVCRGLSLPCFWQNTYRSVSIYDKNQLHKFARTIELSPNGYSKLLLGESVRHLTLWETLLDTDANLLAGIQQQSTELESVELTMASNNEYPLAFKIPLNCWKKLKMVHISQFDDYEESLLGYEQQLNHLVMHKNIDVDSAFFFPRLTHLDFRAEVLVHSLHELEQINRMCPVLRCLHMGDLDVSWNYDDMVKTRATLPTLSSLTHLALGDVYFSDCAMYQVFGQLYPNLVSLKIQNVGAKPISTMIPTDNTIDSDNEIDPNQFSVQQIHQNSNSLLNHQHLHTWTSMVQSLNQLMTNLHCLRQLHLPSLGVSPYSEDWFPGDLWIQYCAQLEDLRLDWYCKSFKTFGGLTDKRLERKWERVLHLLDLCQDTIQTWHLFLKHDPISMQSTVFEKLAQCSWLHTLIIHTTYESDTTLPIDELLTALPNLKSLEFHTKFGKDLLSPIEKTAPRLRSLTGTTISPHGLTRFVYIGKLHSSRLVAYVHARCPRLSVLHLDGRQTPSKKNVNLQLTGWRLRELDIGSELRVGKMVKTVLVQEMSYSPPRSRWYQFSRGAWYRQRQANKSQSTVANLTITCDYIERCVFKPQYDCGIQSLKY